MKLLRRIAASGRRGAALLLSFLVLIVLAAIVFQLYISTNTDGRVARNDVALATMDQAIESALMEVFDRLVTDAESAPAQGGGGPLGGGGDLGAAGPGAGQSEAPVDSHEDSWGKPQRTMINDLELRVLVQDENSKLNVLGILTPDEEQADKQFERLVRVLDLCREDTLEDIDRSDARRMAEAIREHLTNRMSSVLPKPLLLTDDEREPDRGLPLSLKEFAVLDGFDGGLFRDYRDDRGTIVHSLSSFLTIWSGVTTQEEMKRRREAERAEKTTTPAPSPSPTPQPNSEGGEGAEGAGAAAAAAGAGGEAETVGGAPSKAGVAVNINTAPACVLKSLMDDRDLPWRFWDDVIEYRNLEEENQDPNQEPIYDESGEEIIKRRVFDSLDELDQIAEWSDVGPETREELQQLIDTQSDVFSVYVTARRATGQQDAFGGYRGARRASEREDQQGNALVRTVRSVVWRYKDGDDWKIVPLIRWEVIDYTPFEVLDYPDPDR